MSNIKKNLQSEVRAKKNAKIGIAVSQYNPEISNSLLKSCEKALLDRGVLKKDIHILEVPGAFELPYACQFLADKKKYDVIIAIGCLIKGETPHFDFIAFAMSKGIMDVSLMRKIPVIFGVLTTENLKQAEERIKGGERGDKGLEAALAALNMINLESNK